MYRYVYKPSASDPFEVGSGCELSIFSVVEISIKGSNESSLSSLVITNEGHFILFDNVPKSLSLAITYLRSSAINSCETLCNIDGKVVALSQYKAGKLILMHNSGTKCSFFDSVLLSLYKEIQFNYGFGFI